MLEAFKKKRGEEVRLNDLYALIEAHPAAKARARTNRNVHAKIRQQCQVLRDLGILESASPGVWKLPSQ